MVNLSDHLLDNAIHVVEPLIHFQSALKPKILLACVVLRRKIWYDAVVV